MTKRFINADELELEYYDLSIHGTMAVKSVLPVFMDLLEKQPTADVIEVRHEKWKEMAEYEHGGIKKLFFVCPLCGRIEYQKEPYCHCGAKMDKGEEENIKE